MEVGRISKIGSLGSQASPAWQTSAVRRRRFVEEVEPPLEDDSAEEQSAAQDEPAEENSSTFSATDEIAPDSAEAPGTSFRAIA